MGDSVGYGDGELSEAEPMSKKLLPDDYPGLLDALKSRIAQERVRAVMAANAAMVLLYWDIGRAIGERQDAEGWGAKVIERLSADLRRAFPDMRGLSVRNLRYMRAFAAAWPDREFVQQAAAQIPWTHNMVLLDKLDDPDTRLWYAAEGAGAGLVAPDAHASPRQPSPPPPRPGRDELCGGAP